MHKRPRVLLVHNSPARFVQIDRDLLRERYDVTERYERSRRRIRADRVATEVMRHDIVFCWFASWHSVLPLLFARVLQKASILVIGGYDIASLPQIGYGHQLSMLGRWLTQSAIRLATTLVTFSQYSRQEAILNAKVKPDRIRMIYLGVPDLYGTLPPAHRERVALSVGNVNRSNLTRKGHMLFVSIARHVPDVRFVLAGRWADGAVQQLLADAPPNLSCPGWLNLEQLARLYAGSSVYLQLSQHEGFGMSVAEAMLAGSLPIVTPVGSLPEVVGDTGYYVDANKPTLIVHTLLQALDCDPTQRRAARERVLANFPLEARRRKLHELVEEALNDNRRR